MLINVLVLVHSNWTGKYCFVDINKVLHLNNRIKSYETELSN